MLWRSCGLIVCVAFTATGCHDTDAQRPASNSASNSASRETVPDAPSLPTDPAAVDASIRGIADHPVHAVIRHQILSETTDQTFQLMVDVHIAPGWHIYAAEGDSGPFSPTALSVELPQGMKMEAGWTYPEMRSHFTAGELADVYMDSVTFRAEIRLQDAIPEEKQTILCRLEYQACNQFRCLPIQTLDLTLDLKNESRIGQE